MKQMNRRIMWLRVRPLSKKYRKHKRREQSWRIVKEAEKTLLTTNCAYNLPNVFVDCSRLTVMPSIIYNITTA